MTGFGKQETGFGKQETGVGKQIMSICLRVSWALTDIGSRAKQALVGRQGEAKKSRKNK
jgi:hypothetical protein